MQIKYIIILGGVFILSYLTFQVLSGLGKIKVPFSWHKIGGVLLLIIAIFHAIIGLLFLLK